MASPARADQACAPLSTESAASSALAAALLQRSGGVPKGAQESYAPVEGGLAANLAHSLVTHLTEVRKLGPEGESLPLLLDDPFLNLDPSVKPALLELLSHSAGNPQVIFLTNDPDVCTWARLEALTGEIGVVEAAASAEDEADSVDSGAQA